MIRLVVLALACALAFAACERIVELTPAPDARALDAHSPSGSDAGFDPDAFPLGDAFVDGGLQPD
ncbi:MAG TPA: hypothetical protein VGF94_06215 [Kofleriaceae bacterium]|jgi:hypothetical protein